MFDRILVPLDGSTDSEATLAAAQRVAARGADVFLLHVIPHLAPAAGPPSVPYLELPEHVERYLDGLAAKLSNVRARTFVDEGDPADRIIRVALSLNAGLIAMTTHARKGLERLLMGSVAQKVLLRASLPVLLVRPDVIVPARPLRRILVPLDESTRSARMIEVVRPLALRADAEVVLLHVLPMDRDPLGALAPGGTGRMETHDPRRRFQEIADTLEAAGIASWPVVTRGDAAAEILHQARTLDVDLIAIATHGRTGLDRILMGSVAEGVVRGADRPVLALRVVSTPRLQTTERTAP